MSRQSQNETAQEILSRFNSLNINDSHCPPLEPVSNDEDETWYPLLSNVTDRPSFYAHVEKCRRREIYEFSDPQESTVHEYLSQLQLADKFFVGLRPWQITALKALIYYQIQGRVWNGQKVHNKNTQIWSCFIYEMYCI